MGQSIYKTTYCVEGLYNSVETRDLYCIHARTTNDIIFVDRENKVVGMFFSVFQSGNDLLDAVDRLLYPYDDEYPDKLKEGVEVCLNPPWENK